MALKAEQHEEIAASYAKAASDLFISPKQREVFARKAEFFRLMAKLAAKKNASSQIVASAPKQEPVPRQPSAAASDASLSKVLKSFRDRANAAVSTEPNAPTPAHMMALMHLALRWRLFRLETETFGRGRVKH
jgi:hypothetical protein